MLSTVRKTLARVLLSCLVTHQELDLLPESKCGSLRSCETTSTDIIFVVYQVVDLIRASDNVSQQGLWSIKSNLGCPTQLIQMVHQFHNGMMGRVLVSKESSRTFPVTNGAKHDFGLAPTVLSMFSAMLNDAFQVSENQLQVQSGREALQSKDISNYNY